MSGYVDVGGGLGAAVLANGLLNVVAGPLFAQIERERADGPRYVEAVREARVMRDTGVYRAFNHRDRPTAIPRAYASERTGGIPEGWFDR